MRKIFLILTILVPFITRAQVTLIPDATFEQLLVNMNIDSDGIINGQILTSDAQNVKQLNFGHAGSFPIQDLTGIEAFTDLEQIEGYYHALTTINLTTLTKLKKLVLPSNCLSKIDFSANKDLEYLDLGNDLERMQFNLMTDLDLSNNTNLKEIYVFNLFTLERLNMRNNTADSVTISLGHNSLVNYPYNVCIEVDDYVAATNGTAPYDKWAIYNAYKHFFSDNCVLSVEKFVEQNFKMYPNPATDYVTVEQKETNGVTLQAVQILDSSGKWIRSVKENFNHIDVSALSKGMYLFVIQTDKGNKTEKILIK